MSEGRRRDAFDRSAPITAIVANVYRDAKARPSPFRLRDFHPLLPESDTESILPGTRVRAENIEDLKVFLDR